MKTIPLLFVAGIFAALPLAVQAKLERVVEKTFSVQPGGLLTVETQGGDVKILTSDTHEVKVVAQQVFRTNSETEADEIATKLTLSLAAEGEGITAKAIYEKRPPGFHWNNWPPVQVNFTVSIPKNYHVRLKTSGGDIKVQDLNGKAHVRTSGGNITLAKVSGDVDASTSGGDVRLGEGLGTVRLRTSGGNISVDHAVGVTDLNTSGGDIRIGAVDSSLDARTSGGNVTADRLGAFTGDSRLETSGGNVSVNVPKSLGFELEASTSGGQVNASGLTITINKGGAGRSKLSGTVNGGGPRLKLRSSGGDISVHTH